MNKVVQDPRNISTAAKITFIKSRRHLLLQAPFNLVFERLKHFLDEEDISKISSLPEDRKKLEGLLNTLPSKPYRYEKWYLEILLLLQDCSQGGLAEELESKTDLRGRLDRVQVKFYSIQNMDALIKGLRENGTIGNNDCRTLKDKSKGSRQQDALNLLEILRRTDGRDLPLICSCLCNLGHRGIAEALLHSSSEELMDYLQEAEHLQGGRILDALENLRESLGKSIEQWNMLNKRFQDSKVARTDPRLLEKIEDMSLEMKKLASNREEDNKKVQECSLRSGGWELAVRIRTVVRMLGSPALVAYNIETTLIRNPDVEPALNQCYVLLGYRLPDRRMCSLRSGGWELAVRIRTVVRMLGSPALVAYNIETTLIRNPDVEPALNQCYVLLGYRLPDRRMIVMAKNNIAKELQAKTKLYTQAEKKVEELTFQKQELERELRDVKFELENMRKQNEMLQEENEKLKMNVEDLKEEMEGERDAREKLHLKEVQSAMETKLLDLVENALRQWEMNGTILFEGTLKNFDDRLKEFMTKFQQALNDWIKELTPAQMQSKMQGLTCIDAQLESQLQSHLSEGYLKSKVCQSPLTSSVPELKERIAAAAASVSPDMLQRALHAKSPGSLLKSRMVARVKNESGWEGLGVFSLDILNSSFLPVLNETFNNGKHREKVNVKNGVWGGIEETVFLFRERSTFTVKLAEYPKSTPSLDQCIPCLPYVSSPFHFSSDTCLISCSLPGKRFYLFGGDDGNATQVIRSHSKPREMSGAGVFIAEEGGTWLTLPQLPESIAMATGASLEDGSCLIFGGVDWNERKILKTTYMFDHREGNIYKQLPDIPQPVCGGAATLWKGKHVILIGGITAETETSSQAWAFDLRAQRWEFPSTLPSLNTPRSNLGLVEDSQGQLIAIGGYANEHMILQPYQSSGTPVQTQEVLQELDGNATFCGRDTTDSEAVRAISKNLFDFSTE
ncbi:unnamed protein product [Darwinula stevensoni]|uniref:Uncharacterized protein n=1 Tax=Darwinula stevensoni TaxID=69355 RepID=A0A7R9A9D2_9CRUS|nr:unnamed protein product [Darwinula stevensoni]CAG0897189.1 unnamed protein product [Darwinula stevensoni]